MITAGIDVGAENTKAVILKDDAILSYSIISQGRMALISVVERALNEALEKAGVKCDQIVNAAATGVGSDYATFADEQLTESSCCARGASWLVPSTDTVIDMGADKCLVIKCQNGKPVNSVRNDRCASGTSRLLRAAAKPLGLDVEEMGRLSLQYKEEVNINSTCAVFVESEIISLIHLKYRREDLAKAVFKGLARRIYTMLMKVGFEKDLVMTGGVARNVGMARALEEVSSCDILIPERPPIVEAVGAALIAAERAEVSRNALHGHQYQRSHFDGVAL